MDNEYIPMTKKVILSLFDYSTIMAEPWANAGYLCYCVDIKHPPGEHQEGNIIKVGADIMEWMPPHNSHIAATFIFVPCTHTAISGARYFKRKGLSALISTLELWERSIELAEYFRAPYFIENPVSTVATYWRQPDYKFNPCDYGGYKGGSNDGYTKKTCLWIGNGLVIPPKKSIEPIDGSKMWSRISNQEKRSETPRGFARAIYESNSVK